MIKLPTEYQEFIATSRYARWIEDQVRRETWEETVERYTTSVISPKIKDLATVTRIRDAILKLEVMPSMRGLMTAGDAFHRDNVCGYNCAYLPIEHPYCFDEAMYILLCGTGVGFSVERQDISKLPAVPESIRPSVIVFTIADSKEGWAKALRQMITSLYEGYLPEFDYTEIRPAGARLKTFGGRASGPAPLKELMDYVTVKFVGAKGRKLTSLECHDIMCKIGEVVVVGGVRRSAMISLSNLSDDRMRHSKSGQWWEREGQRALANNSAVYSEKPDSETFLREWLSLVESKSGERGIFNREAAINQVKGNGRRSYLDADTGDCIPFGTNPCSEIILRPYQFCNLSEPVVRREDTIETLQNKVEIGTIIGTVQASYTNFPYLRDIWRKNCEEEALLGVSFTGILDNPLMTLENEGLQATLTFLKNTSIETNKQWSRELGINQSTAITCVKPSGTVSQLVDAASGIHARHSHYYIRSVRGDNKDPLTQFMISQGIPSEPCVMKPDNTTVFFFPVKAPDGCITREDLTAIEHLDLWMEYQRYWCEHKPSVTISVKDDEWVSVGSYVYENFDSISGVSFLPYSEHTYQQAPYQECSKEEYEKHLAKMPVVEWDRLGEYELEDSTKGSQTLACVAGEGCEIVDV